MTITHPLLDDLVNQVWKRNLERKPLLKHKQGHPITSLPKGTLEEAQADERFAVDCLQLLSRIEMQDLSYDDQLTYQYLKEYLWQESRKVDIWWADFPVTPYSLFWVHAYAKELFEPYPLRTDSDAQTFLSLLRDFTAGIESLLVKLRGQAERGWYLPKAALPQIISLLDHLKTTVPQILSVPTTRIDSMESSKSQPIAEQIKQIIETQCMAAFHELISYLESHSYQASCPDLAGMGQYPGGEEAYRLLVRLHTTLDLTPEEIHEMGLREVAKLTDEMARVREQLGFHGSEEEFLLHLKEIGKLHAKSPEEVEERYKYHLDRIEPLMEHYFLNIPKAAYQVKRLDPAFESGVAYGYFRPPSESNPVGTYFYNSSDLENRSQLQAAALIYHEILPGHHFQVALQHENQLLPRIRRESMDVTGYIEGWAEYASGLPYEMGLYESYDWYGRLIHERFIAQRLVVDTGMNLLGWSLQQARDYMAQTTIESAQQIASETLRFSTESPGQALAYRVGHLKILELREKAKQELGEAFDIRKFHDALLSPGSLPLYVLEQHIDTFIAQNRENAKKQ